MDIQKIAATLPSDLTIHLEQVEDSVSTMAEAKTFPETPLLLVAPDQKQAHGRYARPFFTQKDHGIYLSLKLELDQQIQHAPLYTLLTGVAMCEAIEELTSLRPQIKWVNDLFLNGKKFAGILAEAQLSTTNRQLSTLIIGLGLNFDILQTAFPQDVAHKVTSLFPDGHAPITKEALVASFVSHFFDLLKVDTAVVVARYKERLFLLGQQITFSQEGQEHVARVLDVDEAGALVVALADGQQVALHSGEVHLVQF